MANKEYKLESKKGVVNRVILSKEAAAQVVMEEDSVLYVKTKILNEKNGIKLVEKQLWLSDLVDQYNGPSIYLDFNEKNELIGIEIMADGNVVK